MFSDQPWIYLDPCRSLFTNFGQCFGLFLVSTVQICEHLRTEFQWIRLRENLQETIDFPMKYGVSCNFPLKPIQWELGNDALYECYQRSDFVVTLLSHSWSDPISASKPMLETTDLNYIDIPSGLVPARTADLFRPQFWSRAWTTSTEWLEL